VKQAETTEVRCVGTVLNRSNRNLWRKLEMDAYRDDPFHVIRRPPKGKKGGKAEFFFLYSGRQPVARAAVYVGEGWLAHEKKERAGFICDFVILPDKRHLAGTLIDHCLSVLRNKGAEGVLVKCNNFPALAAHEFKDLLPIGLPTNPPWHIDLFEQRGFVKEQEWLNFRIDLPSVTLQSRLAKWESALAGQNITVKKLNGRSRKELKRYADAACEIMGEHYGYTPSNFMDTYSFFKFLAFGIITRIGRFRIYVMYDEDNEIVGFWSYHPDYSIAQLGLNKYMGKKWYAPVGLMAFPEFIRNIRRTKRATIGSMGLREGWRRKGLARAVDYAFKCTLQEGYKQVDTGSMLVDNAVVVKMAETFTRRYGTTLQRMTYYTLEYRF